MTVAFPVDFPVAFRSDTAIHLVGPLVAVPQQQETRTMTYALTALLSVSVMLAAAAAAALSHVDDELRGLRISPTSDF